MTAPRVELIVPDPGRHDDLLEMVSEFATDRIDGGAMGTRTVDELRDPDVFGRWVAALQSYERGVGLPDGLVASTSRWVVEDGRLVGFVSIRHQLNDVLREYGGHIGYAVRPSERGRGIATAATVLALNECRRLCIDPVLLTCDVDNVASARVIEGNGGVLEDIRGSKRRYWIRLDGLSDTSA